VPLYVHPFSPVPQVHEAYYSGFSPLVSAEFSLRAWGWHNEAGIHVLRLILAGTFEKFPDLQVISGHWGEMVPFYLQRLDDVMPPTVTGLSGTVSEIYRSHVWVRQAACSACPTSTLSTGSSALTGTGSASLFRNCGQWRPCRRCRGDRLLSNSMVSQLAEYVNTGYSTASGQGCSAAGPGSVQQRPQEPVRSHQSERYRIGVRLSCLQARAGPQDDVPYADQVLAVGAAPGLVDQAAIGLVGQDAAPPVRGVELLAPGRQCCDGGPQQDPFLGQDVARCPVIGGGEDSCRSQRLEAVGQHGPWQSHVGREVAETTHAQKRIANDEKVPPLADDLQRA
jgi:Amidohydrolase